MANPTIDLEIEDMETAAAGDAEAWAVGKRSGVDVAATDPTYQNNAKYYAQILSDAYDESGVSKIVVDGVKGARICRFGRCTTAAATAEKTVELTEGTFELVNGARVSVLFDQANTASSPRLNVAGTGAKPIYIEGQRFTTGQSFVDSVRGLCDFVYDTTSDVWQMVGGLRFTEVLPEDSLEARFKLGIVSAYDKYNWNHKGSVNSVSAGTGLKTSDGNAITDTGSLEVDLLDDTALTGAAAAAAETAGRIYPVAVDSAGHLAVVVPWTDTDTVTRVKGNTESDYRSGDVNLTPANIGAKALQAPVSDPAASGDGIEFISGVSQDAQGVITPAKKTVRAFGGATASAAGTAGVVPAPAAGDQGKILRGDGSWVGHLYGTCSSGAGTVAKTVSIDGFLLQTGAGIRVKFTNSNTAASPTLNVSGTGAKPIVTHGTTAVGVTPETSWQRGAVLEMVYDGTSWVLAGWMNDNDNTVPMPWCGTAAATGAKTAVCDGYTLQANSFVPILFAYGDSTGTPTLNINGTGAKPVYVSDGTGDYGQDTFPAGFYLAWYDGTKYLIRTDGGMPGPYTYRQGTFSVTVPAGDTSYILTDSRITAGSRCDGHNMAAQGIATGIGWSFSAGAVTFTLDEAQSSAVSFAFSIVF